MFPSLWKKHSSTNKKPSICLGDGYLQQARIISVSPTGIKSNEVYHCTDASTTEITGLAPHHSWDKEAPCTGAVPLCTWHTLPSGSLT